MLYIVLQQIAPLRLFRCKRAWLWGLPKERKAISRLRIRWKEHAWYSGSLDLKITARWIPSGEVRIGWMWGKWIRYHSVASSEAIDWGSTRQRITPNITALNRVSGIGKCFHRRIHWECRFLRPGLPNTACIQELAFICGLLFVTDTCGCLQSTVRRWQLQCKINPWSSNSWSHGQSLHQPCLSPKSCLSLFEANPNGVDTETVRVLTCQLAPRSATSCPYHAHHVEV